MAKVVSPKLIKDKKLRDSLHTTITFWLKKNYRSILTGEAAQSDWTDDEILMAESKAERDLHDEIRYLEKGLNPPADVDDPQSFTPWAETDSKKDWVRRQIAYNREILKEKNLREILGKTPPYSEPEIRNLTWQQPIKEKVSSYRQTEPKTCAYIDLYLQAVYPQLTVTDTKHFYFDEAGNVHVPEWAVEQSEHNAMNWYFDIRPDIANLGLILREISFIQEHLHNFRYCLVAPFDEPTMEILEDENIIPVNISQLLNSDN